MANKSATESPVKTLKISISGVRGVIGDTLTPELLSSFSESFGTYLDGGLVVIGRDTRTSGEMVSYAVVAGLTSSGCAVIDLGIVPVPTVQMMVRHFRARGGIAITASHNPAQWNALKFIRDDGCFLNNHQARDLLGIYHQGEVRRAPAGMIPSPLKVQGTTKLHAEAIIEKFGKLKGKKLRVAVDCVNGAGSVMSPGFLRELGCDVVELHTEPDGHFPRPPEPLPQNLKKLCETVRKEKADIGFAQDADADRLAIVDERGKPIGEEYTLAIAVDFVLRREKGTVVVNLSTSRAIDDIAANHKCKIVRTKIGEINVVERMKSEDAVIGGEGNGGVIYPAVNYGRDSFVGMAIVLHHVKQSRKKISALAASLPQYKM
ncbi:MAG: phosphoglucosamine mutase, partial [bacterium]